MIHHACWPHHRSARLFAEDCRGLATFAKRLGPLLDDLEDNIPDPGGEEPGVRAIQVLLPYMSCMGCCHAQHSRPGGHVMPGAAALKGPSG